MARRFAFISALLLLASSASPAASQDGSRKSSPWMEEMDAQICKSPVDILMLHNGFLSHPEVRCRRVQLAEKFKGLLAEVKTAVKELSASDTAWINAENKRWSDCVNAGTCTEVDIGRQNKFISHPISVLNRFHAAIAQAIEHTDCIISTEVLRAEMTCWIRLVHVLMGREYEYGLDMVIAQKWFVRSVGIEETIAVMLRGYAHGVLGALLRPYIEGKKFR